MTAPCGNRQLVTCALRCYGLWHTNMNCILGFAFFWP